MLDYCNIIKVVKNILINILCQNYEKWMDL